MIPVNDLTDEEKSKMDEKEVLSFIKTLREIGIKHGDGHDGNMVYDNKRTGHILLIDWAHACEIDPNVEDDEMFLTPGGLAEDDY